MRLFWLWRKAADMSENPVRPNIDAASGGAEKGWGAPLKADHGPADFRRPGLLFNGMVGRGAAPMHAAAAGPAVPAGMGPAGMGTWARQSGSAARSVPAPVMPLRQRTAEQAPPRLRAVRPAPPAVGTLTHLDLRSVARVSAVFYGIVLMVMVVASVLLWFIADAAGAVHSIDHSVQSLFGLKSYSLHPGTVAMYACAAGVVVAVAGTAFNVLAAAVYNLVAEVVGGVKVRVGDT